MTKDQSDHPFTPYLRTIARGASLSRPLDETESEAAMRLVLDGRVEPEQLGAFLILLRYRKETASELTGFVRAARALLPAPTRGVADLDWPSYADRHSQQPYFLLSALLLAQNGIRVAMHGIPGKGPATTPKTLAALGISAAASLAEGERRLMARGFVYLPLAAIVPPLAKLFSLRAILGVRTLANTVGRELNPLSAAYQLQGVFHPTYLGVHQEAARRLGQPAAAIFKGGGGEVQRNPEKPCRVALVNANRRYEEEWPALWQGERYAWRDEEMDPARVVALWQGATTAPAPERAVIGTAALALKLMRRVKSQDEAIALAQDMWHRRQPIAADA